jgi:hypothetical protein
MALPTVDFLTWALGVGANVETQADYSTDPAQQVGVGPGLARSALFNKSQRQSALVTSTLAMLMASVTQNAILDDGDQEEFWKNLWAALLGVSYFVDTGTANHIVVAAPESLSFDVARAGIQVSVKLLHTTTGPTDFAYMGHTPAPVVYTNGGPVGNGDLLIGSIIQMCFDGTNWQVVSVPSNGVRQRLQAATIYNVDFSAGNDSTGDGSVGLPWKTLQHAWLYIQANVDGGGNSVTITQAGPGAGFIDTGGLAVTGPVPGIAIIRVSLGGGINNAGGPGISATAGAQLNVFGTSTVRGSTYNIVVSDSAGVDVGGGLTLGACAAAKIYSQSGGIVSIIGDYTTTGNATAEWDTDKIGTISVVAAATITLSGTPAYSDAFASSSSNGVIAADQSLVTFVGGATGKRFSADTGGGIFTNGATAASYFPGSIAGTPAVGTLGTLGGWTDQV